MGLFIGDNAPSKIFVGDSEVSKVFVGDTQVRPNEITETYTIVQQSSSGSGVGAEVSIAKAGYKISSVVIETEGQSRGSSYWGNMNSLIMSADGSTNPKKFFRYCIGFGANNYSRLEYNNGSSTTNTYNFTGYSRTENNVCTFLMDRTGGSATINGTTTTWTYTSTEESVALDILDSVTPYVRIETTQGTNGPATITVTYEPI